MKKTAYYIAIAICGIMIILLVGAMVFPALSQSQGKEKIVGQWFCDAFNGNGGKYVTFSEDGTVHLYEEVTAANGMAVSQDSSSYGTMTYEVLRGGRLRLTVSVMGVASSETCDYKFKGNDTLILGDDTYIRQ